MFSQIHVVHDQTHLETRHGGRLPLEWVLLDNQSTIDVFVNRRLLKNIRHIGQYIYIHCDRIPSTTPGEEPPRDARDSGSARSHSTHLETSSSDRP